MDKFTPTYLYIKRHRQTGMLYLGKMKEGRRNIHHYLGSGKRWMNHLEKHGKNVETIWHQLFTNKDELVRMATHLSKTLDICRSDDWANIKPETGLDGGVDPVAQSALMKGVPKTAEHRAKIASAKKGRKRTAAERRRISEGCKGRKLSAETKAKLSEIARRRWEKHNEKDTIRKEGEDHQTN